MAKRQKVLTSKEAPHPDPLNYTGIQKETSGNSDKHRVHCRCSLKVRSSKRGKLLDQSSHGGGGGGAGVEVERRKGARKAPAFFKEAVAGRSAGESQGGFFPSGSRNNGPGVERHQLTQARKGLNQPNNCLILLCSEET